MHTFQFTNKYVAPDAPDGYRGEAHIIKIPDDVNCRWCILFMPYIVNLGCFYIGNLWINNNYISWVKCDINELTNRAKVYTSYNAPTSADGKDGDVWIKY